MVICLDTCFGKQKKTEPEKRVVCMYELIHSLHSALQQILSQIQYVADIVYISFPDGSASKEFACNTGDIGYLGSIPESGRSPGQGNGNPFQYFCLDNPMDRGAWWATVHGVTRNQT